MNPEMFTDHEILVAPQKCILLRARVFTEHSNMGKNSTDFPLMCEKRQRSALLSKGCALCIYSQDQHYDTHLFCISSRKRHGEIFALQSVKARKICFKSLLVRSS